MKTQKEPQLEYLTDVSIGDADWEVWGHTFGYLGSPVEFRNEEMVISIDEFNDKFPKESANLHDRLMDAAMDAEMDANESAREREIDYRIDEARGK